MSTAINGLLLAVSGSLAASITAKATLVAALGLIGAGLARRSRAAVRHALLAATFGVLLFLPVAAIVAPPVNIALSAAAWARVLPATAASAHSAAPAHTRVGVPSAAPQSAGLSPSALLLMLWIAGAALFLAPVATGMWQVSTLRRSALPWPQGQPAADRLALDTGIHRRVDVLLHGALPGPMTCGVMHPAIVLPEDAPAWAAEDLNRALIHEVEHVRRGDWVSHCLARVVCAVYWFHPLVWIAWRRLLVEAERSCDDAVLRRSEATAYADQLVGLARRLAAVAKGPAARSPLLAMANRADLATRVGAVLDGRQRRGRAGTVAVSLASAAAMVLVVTVSPLRVVAAPQTAGAAPNVKFISTTSLVLTAVIVSDSSGGSVDGLAANDFAVAEDGRPQNIMVFEFQKVDGQPLNPPLSSYYIIGYYASQRADGSFRKIQIAGKDARMAKLDYRPGYYANQPSAGADTGGLAAGVTHSMPNVRPPVVIFKKDPEYSDEARKAKYQGSVVLSVEIDESGRPTNIRVLRSLGMGLDEQAVEALSQWRFKPGTKDGQPVTVQSQVEMNFQLL